MEKETIPQMLTALKFAGILEELTIKSTPGKQNKIKAAKNVVREMISEDADCLKLISKCFFKRCALTGSPPIAPKGVILL